jgi:protein-S-isoprenylcysteine O-methyltransferase Ste14
MTRSALAIRGRFTQGREPGPEDTTDPPVADATGPPIPEQTTRLPAGHCCRRVESGMLGRMRPLPFMTVAAAVPFWVIFAFFYLAGVRTQRRSRRNQSGTEIEHRSLPLFAACTVIAFVVAFLLASWLPAAAIGGPRWPVFVAGLVMMVAGIGLRQWAIASLGRFFTTNVRIHNDEHGGHTVIDTGPYRWMRHPSYTGSLTTIVGTGLALGNWAALAVLTIVPTLALLFRIRVEETALLTGLGEPYRRYTATVRSRLIPGLW